LSAHSLFDRGFYFVPLLSVINRFFHGTLRNVAFSRISSINFELPLRQAVVE